MAPATRLRWFWRLYWPVSALAVALVLALPSAGRFEQRLYPIRVDSRISDKTRTADRLCWVWSGEKLRAAPFDQIDVFLDHGNGDRSFPEVFNRDTRRPWHTAGALPLGPSTMPFCIDLLANSLPTERLVLKQVLHYRGFMGLWDVPIALPDVASEGEPP